MIVMDPRQDLELRIQQLEQKILPQYLTSTPPIPEEWIRKGQLILQAVRWLAAETASMQQSGDAAFIRSKRYGFELILIIGSIWFLLGKIAAVPSIPSLVISIFLGLFMFWFLLSEERKFWDRRHMRDQQVLNRYSQNMLRLVAEKQHFETLTDIPELTEQVISTWHEENHIWQMHANERAALAELRQQLNELIRSKQ